MLKRLVIIVAIQAFVMISVWFWQTDWLRELNYRGVNLFFLLTASKTELAPFYPKYGFAIQVAIKLIGATVGLGGCFSVLKNASFRNQVVRLCSDIWRTERVAIHGIGWLFLCTLILSLSLYYVLRWYEIDSFENQLHLTRIFLSVNVFNILMSIVVNFDQVKSSVLKFLCKPELPYALSLTRILFFLSLIFTYSFQVQSEGLGQLERVSLPLIGWLVQNIPISPDIHYTLRVLGILCAVMIVIGYRTRFFLLLNMFLVFYIISIPHFFGKLAHEQLIIWMSWILAVSPCYEVFSVDAKLSRKPLMIRKSSDYGFHLKVIWLHFGLIYFYAGYYKLWKCGFDWALTGSMINQIQIEWFEHFDKVPSFRLDKFPALAMFGGLSVIVFELAFPFLLFSRIGRWSAVVGGLALHNFLGKLMYIAFKQLQTAYLVFIPWNWVAIKLRPSLAHVKTTSTELRLTQTRVLFPIFVLSMNLIFGAFNLNSYPFSIYPTYSDIVPDNVSYFEYHVLDNGLSNLNVWNEGEKADFFWERYTRIEYHIISEWEQTGKLDTAGVIQQWNRWKLDVPSLQEVDSVEVFVKTTPIDPESRDKVLRKSYLMTITPKILNSR